jgi:hypothetical protein
LSAAAVEVAAAILTIALQGATAFFASVGRGYIAPLAWAVLGATIAWWERADQTG